MNTDKIFAEAIANEYAPKKASKVVALKKLDRKAKSPANIFAFWRDDVAGVGNRNVPFYEGDRRWVNLYDDRRYYRGHCRNHWCQYQLSDLQESA